MDLPIVPVQRYAEFRGTLNPGQSSMTVQIPVDAMTSSLGISVRPSGNGIDPAESPVIERMQLVDLQGDTVDQIATDSQQGQPPPQSVNVLLHNAPAGGQLLVQITTAAGALATPTNPTTVSGPASSWNVSFVLDVQRQEDSAQQGAPPAQGLVAVGTVPFASSSQSELTSLSQETASLADATAGALLDGQGLVTEAADFPAAGLVPEGLDSFNVRIPTGPLASRSAGPLGPILESWEVDLTPPVDRHERGLFQEIDGLDADQETDLPERRSRLTKVDPSDSLRDDTRTSDLDQTGGPVVALTGGGGFPLKVTGLASGDRAQLPALLASIPTTSALERQASGPAETDAPVALAAESLFSTDRSDCPDYVKAACGLALGVGLTSGPLFADLLASVQARLPKWMRRQKGDKSN